MNKLILTVLSVFAAVSVANAEVLLWQVSSPVTASGSQYTWDTAKIYSVKGTTASGGTPLTSVWGEESSYQGESVNVGTFSSYAVGAYLPEYSKTDTTTSFYIELFNNTGKVAYSDVVNIATLRDQFVKDGVGMQAIGVGWNGGNFTVVPEPTSGLMLLLGAAMLGLRRKRIA